MSLNYTKKTLSHFTHPQNIGTLKNADAEASVGNMVCGDQLSFSIKVKNGVIKDINFLSFGCASNIATASVLTEKVKGMTLEKAKNFDWQKIVKDLGGLPSQKIHCSILAVEGLRKVIAEYEGKHSKVAVPSKKTRPTIKKKAKPTLKKKK
jgi:nitrogen fixation NifU-like protein